MSETNTHAPLPALTAPPPRPPRSGWLKHPATFIAAIALGGVVLQAWQSHDRIKQTREELSRRLAASDTAQREAQAQAKQSRETLDALQAKFGALDARLAEMQGQQLALESMYQELSRVRDDRLLAEIEQAVTLAAQQLQLAGNVQAALIALQGIEAQLAKSVQPQFIPLRKLIIRDIDRLKALPGADVPGIALKLDAILDGIAKLPLTFEHRPAPEGQGKSDPTPQPPVAENGAESTAGHMARIWLLDLWQEIRQLVRIERIDRPDPGLLAPREAYFLRENLRLRLLSARLALLARDGRTFRNDLRQADGWLELYFDGKAPAVAEARDALKALARLDVMRDPADLNETLAALRNFKLSRDRSDRGPAR